MCWNIWKDKLAQGRLPTYTNLNLCKLLIDFILFLPFWHLLDVFILFLFFFIFSLWQKKNPKISTVEMGKIKC
jgi:hypothetical protein